MMNFKKLLSILILHHHNLRVLHWNVVGNDFDPVHGLLGGYYEQVSDYVDEVAELGISLNVNPVSLHEALNILGSDEDDSYIELNAEKVYDSKACFETIQKIFMQIIVAYETIYTDKTIPASIINKLQEHQQYFRKECEYKNKRRLSL